MLYSDYFIIEPLPFRSYSLFLTVSSYFWTKKAKNRHTLSSLLTNILSKIGDEVQKRYGNRLIVQLIFKTIFHNHDNYWYHLKIFILMDMLFLVLKNLRPWSDHEFDQKTKSLNVSFHYNFQK